MIHPRTGDYDFRFVAVPFPERRGARVGDTLSGRIASTFASQEYAFTAPSGGDVAYELVKGCGVHIHAVIEDTAGALVSDTWLGNSQCGRTLPPITLQSSR